MGGLVGSTGSTWLAVEGGNNQCFAENVIFWRATLEACECWRCGAREFVHLTAMLVVWLSEAEKYSCGGFDDGCPPQPR